MWLSTQDVTSSNYLTTVILSVDYYASAAMKIKEPRGWITQEQNWLLVKTVMVEKDTDGILFTSINGRIKTIALSVLQNRILSV